MAAILTDNPAYVRASIKSAPRVSASAPVNEAVVDLGIWLSGIVSFLGAGHRFVHGQAAGAEPPHDASREFQIVHSGLKRCVVLNAQVLSSTNGFADPEAVIAPAITAGELFTLAGALHESVLLSESLVHSTVLGPGQWRVWSDHLNAKFGGVPVVDKLIRNAETGGTIFLPSQLLELGSDLGSITPEQAELLLIVPRFGMVLRWLAVVGKMLQADEPLKPTLLIFSRVGELVADLTSYINHRLDRFPNQEAGLFSTLDAASYTASIELKKVYSQELAGLAAIRPTPSIYARIETAHSLLNDGFQQIIAGFVQMIRPETRIFDLFPEFQVKLDQSIQLREQLWSTAQAVQSAEKRPERDEIDRMRGILKEFRDGSMRYLFYKDTETVERFIEEILVTNQVKDLVPILHRFGAFLDTLFGQVSLRAVLEGHPFGSHGSLPAH